MPDQTINPLLPVNPTRDVLKKKKDQDQPKNRRQQDDKADKKPGKKGIIDTYA